MPQGACIMNKNVPNHKEALIKCDGREIENGGKHRLHYSYN